MLIGDSGGNQKGMKEVAGELNASWRPAASRVHFIPEFYDYGGVTKWLEEQGIKQTPEGLHDDFAITAMMMTRRSRRRVRMKQRIAAGKFRINGVDLPRPRRPSPGARRSSTTAPTSPSKPSARHNVGEAGLTATLRWR